MVALIITPVQSPADEVGTFRDQVAPILEKHCLRCHQGPEPKGGLSLSDSEETFKGGDSGPAVTPGKPGESLLIAMISGEDPEMPQNAPSLSPAQVAILKTWIEQGAPWPEGAELTDRQFGDGTWWSLLPLEKIAPPAPPVGAEKWARSEIDRFIFAKLAEKGLGPAPEADRRTLVRRLTFDLHGLPPTPDEIGDFLNDDREDAYERLVDRLLASPRYGERWGRHWLDIVQYGDTHGFDKDKRREHAWRYRDYVIDAFNADMPYGQFILEQVAGDALHPEDASKRIATGFVVAGPWDFVGQVELAEGTLNKEITRALDRDDMVANTLSTFSSLTVHCARCHDHPFDPIKQEDYYRLQAVFAGIERADVSFDDPKTSLQRKLLEVQRRMLLERRDAVAKRIQSVSSPELVELDERIRGQERSLAKLRNPLASEDAAPTSPSNGYHGDISAKPDATQWVEIDLGDAAAIDDIYLFPARPTDYPDTPGFGFPLRFTVSLSNRPDHSDAIRLVDHASHDFANPGNEAVRVRGDGQKGRYLRVTANQLWSRQNDFVFALAELAVLSGDTNVALGAPVRASSSIEAGRWSTKNLVDGFRSRGKLPDLADPTIRAAMDRRAEFRETIQADRRRRTELAESLVSSADREELARVHDEVAKLDAREESLGSRDKVYAAKPLAKPRPIHVLHRGEVTNPGREVAPGTVSCVPGMPNEFSLLDPDREGDRRIALARWLADESNVLTWRSIVNRVWQYHFGRGIVDTPNDFGHLGSLPTHPELLDYLALEFLARGQSVKSLHKQIVTSAAYRQSSEHRADAAMIDSGNQYLWRMNRRRLDAESLRDAVLAVTGKIDYAMGGPGFNLFGFKDDHSPHYLYDQFDVDDPKSFRRSVYRFVVRSVPDPFMECLDCADPSSRVPVRDETITALQALALLNNKFMVRQAKHFADRLTPLAKSEAGQIELAYEFALGRKPTAEESRLMTDYAKQHGLPAACRVLFNTSEFVFVD